MGFRKPTTQPQPMSTLDDQKKRQQRGTGFSNISTVLSANKGAGKDMGQRIGSNVAGQASDVRQGIQAGQTQFGNQAGKANAAAQSNIGNVSQFQKNENEDQAAYEQRLANPNDPNMDLQQAGKTMRETSYTGPMGIENANQLQMKSANAAAMGTLAGNRAGQGELLRNTVAGRGGYTRGQNALDQLLLTKEGQQGLQQARSATSGLGQQTNTALKTATQQAQGMKSAIEQQKQDVSNKLQESLSGKTGIQEAAKQQAQQYNTQGQKLQRLLLGKNEDGTTMSSSDMANLPQEDLDLLNNLDQYGLNKDQAYYSKNATEQQNIMNQLAGNINTNQQYRYQGNQSQAAQNLAKLRGDQATVDSISSTQFNDKLFNPVEQENAMKRSNEVAQTDEANRNRLNQLAQMKSRYDQLYNLSGGGTKVKFPHLAPVRMEANQILKDMQAMGADPNQSAASYAAQANELAGQKKTLQQLALERLGQRFDPTVQKGVDPTKTKTQK